MLLRKKLVGLTGKTKRPVHRLEAAAYRAYNLVRRFFVLLDNLIVLACGYCLKHRSSQMHHFCAERTMNAFARHFSNVLFEYRRGHVRDYNTSSALEASNPRMGV